ncbi:MAG: phosphatase PAP2 family protein [Roseiflexaceae bacterium]|nr:phosphatase PAP2 family protein [Roseiflexaceae bacterium]
MADRHNLADETHIASATSRSYEIGLLLSRIFHPIFMNILMFIVVGYFALPNQIGGLLWATISIVTLCLPPTLFFRWRLRQGAYSDEDVSNRHQRTELYLFGLLTLVVGTGVLLAVGLPRPFLALLIAAVVISLLGLLINSFWKISVHAGSVSATATVATLYAPLLGLALWLGALAVGWARVRTGNHTPLQVLAGTLLSACVVAAVFQLML